MKIKAELHEVLLPYPDMPQRRVRVFVPAHEEGERLPVVYMTDGQNLFDEESSGWGCWHTMESVEKEAESGLGAAVIVGIDHGGKHRDNELTPAGIGEVHVTEMENFTEPLGEVFDSFVVDTVMPYIEKNFPVYTDRRHTAFCGSSSGGLQSFFTGLEHSDRFSMLGVFSPAFLLYSEDDTRNWILSKMTSEMPYLYIYTGMGDRLEEKIFNSTEAVCEILTEIGYPYDLYCEIIRPEYSHNEKAWEEIFRDFLHTFLFRCTE